AQDLRHAVINGHRPEHERIATIARNGFDAVRQRAKPRQISLVFAHDHAVVNERNEVRDAVWDRRIDRETRRIGAAAPALVVSGTAGCGAVLWHPERVIYE